MAKSFEDIISDMISDLRASVGNVDTRVGTILRDVFLTPVASRFLDAYNGIDVVSANQGVNTVQSQSDAALENLASNFDISRFSGSYASGLVRFYRYSQPGDAVLIPIGTVVSTNTAVGRLTFRTTSTTYLTPSADYDPDLGAYYVDSLVLCDSPGTIGNVIAGAISYVAVPGIDGVVNQNDMSGGKDVQSNSELAATVKATARGNIGTRTGYEALVRDNFAVDDVTVIAPGDIDYARIKTVGAVDVVVLSNNRLSITESVPFVSPVVTNRVTPSYLPLLSVASIVGTSSTDVQTVLQPGTDYEVVYDTYSDYRRSSQELSYISIHITSFTPKNNSTLDVTYDFSSAVVNVQSFLDREENKIVGADVLAKLGIEIPVIVRANVKVIPNYTSTQVQASIESALTTYFDALLLDDDVQASDVITVIGNVEGVDSVNIETFVLALESAPLVPLEEVSANRQEYIRINLDQSNITVGV